MGSLGMIKLTSFHLLAGILLIGVGSPNLDGTAYGSGGASLERDHTQMSDREIRVNISSRQRKWAGKNRRETGTSCRLSAAEQYAGEVLSYLLQVAVGQEGNPKMRNEWRTTGIRARLKLEDFYGVVHDPEKEVQDLTVLDPNIMDLSRVLYYYDKRLSSTGGRFGVMGLYPAPELIAIRLLLLRKIHRGEKIRLGALMKREALLRNKKISPSKEDLRATNLRTDEMDLVREIIAKAPYLYDYLTCPFLVKAFYKVGAVESDEFVDGKIAEARYRRFGCHYFSGSKRVNAVKIVFLPSMTDAFEYGEADAPFPESGFKATAYFYEMINKLRDEILDRSKSHLNQKINEDKSARPKVIGQEWERLWEGISKEKIAFYVQDRRPLVIYPGNARRVIQDVCPEADFIVILLGKNVYLSLLINAQEDVYPYVNWTYVDIADIRYSQIQEECEKIAEFIYSKIKGELDEIIRKAF
jgi:hypothetical protein